MWDKHNLVALILAVVAAVWSQALIAYGEGKIPIPPEWAWLVGIVAAGVTMALTSLTPYFKLPPKP